MSINKEHPIVTLAKDKLFCQNVQFVVDHMEELMKILDKKSKSVSKPIKYE